MAERSFPLEGTVYTAEEAALWFATRTSGVYASSDLGVSAGSDMTVNVGTGIAWLKYSLYAGVAYANTESKTLALATANANYPRIDRVVVRYSASENRVYLAVLTGTPATNPQPPVVANLFLGDNASVVEISLAQIYVAANASSISAGNITDERLDSSVCGLMRDGVTGIDTAVLEAQTTAQMQTFMNEKQTEFDAWFASIEALLDGDAATIMAKQIAALDAQMPTNNSPLPIARGGTGATDAETARTNLGITPANIGAAALDDNGKVTASQVSSTVRNISQDTTLALEHAGCMLRVMTNSCVITIPAASSVNFPVGTEIEILQWGASIVVSITSASDVYLAGDGKASKARTITIGNNFGVVALKKVTETYWLAVGDFA